MTQIQPLAEPLPPGPSTSQASGGKVRGSRGRGGNSPGASHLPEQCPAGHHVHQLSLRLWSMDFVSCRDRQETATHKLLTQQMRTIDNSGPWWLLAPQLAVIPTEADISMTRLLPAPCPFHTRPGELSWGTFLHQAMIRTAPQTLASPPPALSLPPAFYLLFAFPSLLPFWGPTHLHLRGGKQRGASPKELPAPEFAPSVS